MLLRRGAWFGGLPPPLQQALLAAGRIRGHPRSAQIRLSADPPSDLHALLEGTVQLSKVGAPGNEIVYHVARPSFWFGGLGAMAAVDSGVTATALGRLTLLSVPHAELERLVEREPRHLGPLARLPMGQFALVLEAMEQASRPTAANRVAAKLLWLDAIQRETDEAAASQPLPILQAQLAAMTGLSRQSVNWVLRDLARAGALAVAFKEVRILDRERLTQAAGDAP